MRDERGSIETSRAELGNVAMSAAVVSIRARSFVAARYSTSEVLSTPTMAAQRPSLLDTASRGGLLRRSLGGGVSWLSG